MNIVCGNSGDGSPESESGSPLGAPADMVDVNAEAKNQNQEDSDNTNNSAESNPYEDIELVEDGTDAIREVK